MVRRFFYFTVVAMMATLFASCSEDQTSLSIEDIPGKAKIMGFVTYNSGAANSNDGTTQRNVMLPATGKTIYVEISNASFKGSAGGVTTYKTTTDAKGKFEIEIPAVSYTDVTIKAAGFEGTQKKTVTDGLPATNTLASVEGFFGMISRNVTVSVNETILENMSYNNFTPYNN